MIGTFWTFTFISFFLTCVLFHYRNIFKSVSVIFVLILFLFFFLLSIFESYLIINQNYKMKLPKAYSDKETSDYPYNIDGEPFFETSEFGVQPLPGVYRHNFYRPNGEEIFNVSYIIKENRFRETPKNNSKKVMRVNFFGGSWVFGQGVDQHETMAAYLSTLNNKIDTRNFGNGGWGVHNALAVLESNIDTTGNLNILLTAPWHSERARCKKGQSAVEKPLYVLDKNDIVRRNKGIPYYRKGVLIKAEFGTCRDIEHAGEIIPNYERFLNKSLLGKKVNLIIGKILEQGNDIELYLGMIKKMEKISTENSQDFLVGFVRANPNYFFSKWSNDRIIQEIQENGIEIVDLTLVPETSDKNSYVIDEVYEGHPSPLANQLRADRISDYISEKFNLTRD